MVVNSSAFNFSEVVSRYMTGYYKEAWEAVYEATDEVSREAVKKLRSASRSAFGGTGDYARGWTRTQDKGRLKVMWTVHGKKPTYALAHLLEKGHAKRGGGRVNGTVHIEPIEQWALDEAVDRFVSKMEG